LHIAAHFGHVEVVESLIKSGADVEAIEEVSYCMYSGIKFLHII